MIDYKKAADKLNSVLDEEELRAIEHGLQRIAPQHNGIIEEGKLAGLREKVRAAMLSIIDRGIAKAVQENVWSGPVISGPTNEEVEQAKSILFG